MTVSRIIIGISFRKPMPHLPDNLLGLIRRQKETTALGQGILRGAGGPMGAVQENAWFV
jgi:hypothetical protein